MTGGIPETWGDYGQAILVRLSPKVVIPFVVALVGTLIYALIDGEFDTPQVVALVTTFVYGVLGLAAPAATARGVSVNQKELAPLVAGKYDLKRTR